MKVCFSQSKMLEWMSVWLIGKKGWSPLIIDCYYGHITTVRLLLSSGRNIDILKKSTKDDGGSTALCLAKQRNITDIVITTFAAIYKQPKKYHKKHS